VDLVRDLRGRGVRTALLTQGFPEIQWRKIESLGIEPLFDRIEVAGPGEAKPDPAPFRRVERSLGTAGRGMVMVGDCPSRDFPAADSLGWRTIRLRLPGTLHRDDPDPDYRRPEARSIRALRRILDSWIAGPGSR
jgi:putative hydrolase of the HAD superfamily